MPKNPVIWLRRKKNGWPVEICSHCKLTKTCAFRGLADTPIEGQQNALTPLCYCGRCVIGNLNRYQVWKAEEVELSRRDSQIVGIRKPPSPIPSWQQLYRELKGEAGTINQLARNHGVPYARVRNALRGVDVPEHVRLDVEAGTRSRIAKRTSHFLHTGLENLQKYGPLTSAKYLEIEPECPDLTRAGRALKMAWEEHPDKVDRRKIRGEGSQWGWEYFLVDGWVDVDTSESVGEGEFLGKRSERCESAEEETSLCA